MVRRLITKALIALVIASSAFVLYFGTQPHVVDLSDDALHKASGADAFPFVEKRHVVIEEKELQDLISGSLIGKVNLGYYDPSKDVIVLYRYKPYAIGDKMIKKAISHEYGHVIFQDYIQKVVYKHDRLKGIEADLLMNNGIEGLKNTTHDVFKEPIVKKVYDGYVANPVAHGIYGTSSLSEWFAEGYAKMMIGRTPAPEILMAVESMKRVKQ